MIGVSLSLPGARGPGGDAWSSLNARAPPLRHALIAGWLMLVGVGLWAITWLLNKDVFKRYADFDPTHLDPQGPVN